MTDERMEQILKDIKEFEDSLPEHLKPKKGFLFGYPVVETQEYHNLMEWLPIETCPHSDNPVLVYGQIWNRFNDEGKSDVENWEKPRYWIASNIIDGRCFVDAGFYDGSMAECKATHWMPLPEAP